MQASQPALSLVALPPGCDCRHSIVVLDAVSEAADMTPTQLVNEIQVSGQSGYMSILTTARMNTHETSATADAAQRKQSVAQFSAQEGCSGWTRPAQVGTQDVRHHSAGFALGRHSRTCATCQLRHLPHYDAVPSAGCWYCRLCWNSFFEVHAEAFCTEDRMLNPQCTRQVSATADAAQRSQSPT